MAFGKHWLFAQETNQVQLKLPKEMGKAECSSDHQLVLSLQWKGSSVLGRFGWGQWAKYGVQVRMKATTSLQLRDIMIWRQKNWQQVLMAFFIIPGEYESNVDL